MGISHSCPAQVRIGTSVTLRLSFVDAATDKPVELDSFYFTLVDFDTMASGRAEKLCVDDEANGVASYFYEATGEVLVEHSLYNCDGTTWGSSVSFSATGAGKGCDNPDDPMNLVEVSCSECNQDTCPVNQRDRTVTLAFEDRSSFDIEISADADGNTGNSGRIFYITGKSAMILGCPTQAPTATPAPSSPYPIESASCSSRRIFGTRSGTTLRCLRSRRSRPSRCSRRCPSTSSPTR